MASEYQDVWLIRNPDLIERPGVENQFSIFISPKIIRIRPREHDLLKQFGTAAVLVSQLFPNPDKQTLAGIDTLVKLEFLLPTHVKCLVTGCGRSGTAYIAQLLTAAGLPLGHETMRSGGIASWLLAVDAAKTPWGPARHPFQFEQVFHQTRNPLDAISSMQTIRAESWQFVCAHIACSLEEPLLIRCARYWLHWNQAVESMGGFRYRIEDIANVWKELCSRLSIAPKHAALESVRPHVNTRRGSYSAVTWADLSTLDHRLCLAVQEQAARYGYRV